MDWRDRYVVESQRYSFLQGKSGVILQVPQLEKLAVVFVITSEILGIVQPELQQQLGDRVHKLVEVLHQKHQ